MSYDNYYGKHWARTVGWLNASIDFKKKVSRPLKYLTLCDIQAVDIFMLEQAGVLERDENKFLTNVVICEGDSSKIPKIFEVTKPPLRDSIIQGKLEKLILFEDDQSTAGIDPDTDDDVRNENVRKKLLLKKYSTRLKAQFPFDIINFDSYGTLMRPQRELYKGFKQIFNLQKGIDNFLLFVTTPINHLDDRIEKRFKTDFEQNIANHDEIRDIVMKTVGTENYDELEFKKKVTIGFGKTIVAKLAKANGWKSSHKGVYIYENDAGNHMMSSVIELITNDDDSNVSWYINDVVDIISEMPKCRSYAQAEIDKSVIKNLQAVIRYRDKLQEKFEL